MFIKNFIILNIFLIIFNLNSYNCVLKEKITVGEYLNEKIIAMERLISKAATRPREETNITCTSGGYLNCSNLKNPKIFQTDNYAFLLSGIDLSQIEIPQNGGKKLKFIGNLDGIEDVNEIQHVYAGEWQSYIVILILLPNHFIIYTTKLELNENYLQPRERIRIFHKPYIKFLNSHNSVSNNDLIFLLVNKLNDDIGEIIQYKWRYTHFISDYHLTLQAMDESHIFHDRENTILLLTSYKLNAIEIYYNNNNSPTNYKKIQKIMLNENAVDTTINYYSLNYNEHYFLLCYNKIYKLCKIYKYFDNAELFINVKKLPFNYQKFNKFYYNYYFDNLLVTTNVNNNKLVIFNNYDLNNYKIIECSSIDDIRSIIVYNNYNKIAVIVLNGENKINFVNIVIDNASNNNIDDNYYGDDAKQLLLNTIKCFSRLNNLISTKQEMIDQIKVKTKTVLQKNRSNKIREISGSNLYLTGRNNTVDTINIKQNLDISLHQLFRKVVKLDSIQLNTTRIKRASKIKNLVVKSLNKTDLLLKNANNKIKGNVYIKNNLHLNKEFFINNSLINNINLTNVYLKNIDNSNGGDNKLYGLKLFTNLIADSMNVKTLNNISAQNLFSDGDNSFNGENINIIGNHVVENLLVEELNGANWDEFYRNVYQTDSNRVIHGNLIFTSPFAVKNLQVNKVNNISTTNYLNKITNQTINANIFINKFFANIITTNTINNLEFNNKNLFLINQSAIINGDLLIPNLKIRNNLFLSSTDASTLVTPLHNASKDLTQIYNKNIKIKGNLILNKLFLENLNHSKIVVNDQEFNIQNMKSKYWLKNTKQEIPKFIFNNDIITNQLFIENKLNDYDINKYCRNSFDQTLHNVNNFYFSNLFVDGSIKLNEKLNKQFVLNEIIKNTILLNSDANKIIKILDHKQFNNLIVNKIQVNRINNYEIRNFVLNETNLRIHSLKIHKLNYFNNKKIFVRKKLLINNYRNFFENAIYINRNYSLSEINFKNNLNINKLYSNDFSLHKIYNNSINYNLDNLKIVINGNVLFKENLYVNTINNVNDVQRYFDLLVLKNEPNIEIGGKKIFNNRLVVHHNLLTDHRVNGINLNYVLNNLFLTNTEQIIHPIWWFYNLSTEYLKTRYLNNINTTLFVNHNSFDDKRDIVIKSNLIINNLTTSNRIYGRTQYNIPNIIDTLYKPSRGTWRFIKINNNLYYPKLNYNSKLNYILNNSVARNKNQIITSEIIFDDTVTIKNLKFNNLINGVVNLTAIIKDSLVRNDGTNDTIKIYAPKYFINNLFIKQNYTNRNDLNCNYINNINIVDFNNNMTHWNSIKSKKQFTNILKINKLFVNNEWHRYNKNLNDMVVVDGKKYNNIKINLYDYEIKENLNFANINNFEISDFIVNRIKLDSNETQYINNLTVTGDFIINSVCNINYINNINMSDLVYKNEPSVISGKKIFLNNLIFNSSVNIKYINDVDIQAAYDHTIFINQPETIRELWLPEVVVKSGIILTNVNQIIPSTQTYDLNMNNLKLNLTILNTNLNALKSRSFYKKLDYFDYTKNIDITINQYNNAYGNNYNLLIDSYDNGVYCNLNENCLCPFQYLLNIKNSNKIEINKNHYFNRIFKLHNDFINVTVHTNYETMESCNNNFINSSNLTLASNDKKYTLHHNTIIKSIKLFQYGKTTSNMNNFIVILNTNYNNYNHTNSNNTINLLKITNNNISDLKLQQNIIINGHDVNMNLFNWNIGIILIVTSIHKISFYNNGFVKLYLFNKNQQQFDLLEKFVGQYDLINGAAVNIDGSYMILLAKTNKNYIIVYKLESNYINEDIKFTLCQKIVFKNKLKSITVFEHLENMLFGVTMEDDHYHVYIYNHIEGWIIHSTGYYNSVEHIEPFKIQSKDYLFINGRLSPTAVAIYTQGN